MHESLRSALSSVIDADELRELRRAVQFCEVSWITIAERRMDYSEFIATKSQLKTGGGFAPLWMPDFLFDFQQSLVEWSLLKGRAAIFAGCGLGKTPMQLVFAENVKRKTNKPALILTPLAVGYQTVKEAEKFGIEAHRSTDGKPMPNIQRGEIVRHLEQTLVSAEPESTDELLTQWRAAVKECSARRHDVEMRSWEKFAKRHRVDPEAIDRPAVQ